MSRAHYNNGDDREAEDEDDENDDAQAVRTMAVMLGMILLVLGLQVSLSCNAAIRPAQPAATPTSR